MIPRLICVVLCTAAIPAIASESMKPLPPDAHVAGKSASEWSAAWWQWAFAQPDGMRAYQDPTGVICTQGQRGAVWFLAGR